MYNSSRRPRDRRAALWHPHIFMVILVGALFRIRAGSLLPAPPASAVMPTGRQTVVCHAIINILAPMSPTVQSIPSASPSPVTALHATILQCRFLNCSEPRPRTSAISTAPSAPARSCLFANTNKDAPASFCQIQKAQSDIFTVTVTARGQW